MENSRNYRFLWKTSSQGSETPQERCIRSPVGVVVTRSRNDPHSGNLVGALGLFTDELELCRRDVWRRW